jgi:hypothetical protein
MHDPYFLFTFDSTFIKRLKVRVQYRVTGFAIAQVSICTFFPGHVYLVRRKESKPGSLPLKLVALRRCQSLSAFSPVSSGSPAMYMELCTVRYSLFPSFLIDLLTEETQRYLMDACDTETHDHTL